MHLCTLCTICQVWFLSSQKEIHENGWRHTNNAFKLYKVKFFDIVIPRKKRNLRSNRILRILNKRELKTLQEYWMIIGVSLSLYVNVGIQVKKNRVKSFGIEQMHLNDSTVIVNGQNTIAIYLQQFLNANICGEIFNIAYTLYQNGPHCQRTSSKIINGKKGKMVMSGYKSRGIIERFIRSNEFHLLSDKLATLITQELIHIFPSWLKKLEECGNSVSNFGRLGNIPFSTMSITLDFYNNNHCDIGDIDYGFFIWFSKGKYTNLSFFLNYLLFLFKLLILFIYII